MWFLPLISYLVVVSRILVFCGYCCWSAWFSLGCKGGNDPLTRLLHCEAVYPCTCGVSVNCHPGEAFATVVSGTGRKPDVPWTESGTNGSIWWRNYEAFFEPISLRGRRSFPLVLELKINCSGFEFRRKQRNFVATVPGPCQIEMTSLDFILWRG